MGYCGCISPVISYFEFDISNDILVSNKTDLLIPLIPETDVDMLKEKIICEYKWVISQMEKGKYPNLEFLLEEISAVDLENEIDNREFIILYYLNNDLWKENTQ